MLNFLTHHLKCRFAVVTAFLVFATLATSATAQQSRVSVGFEAGFVAEYQNQAHAPTHAQTFATLGIDSVVISQLTDNGQFGGTQGNDYVVDVTFLNNNGSSSSFTAAVNWRDTQGSAVYAIGLIGSDAAGNPVANPADGSGYVLSSGLAKSYAFQLIGTPRSYQDTPVGVQEPNVSGNAATSGLLDALNDYLNSSTPGTKPSPLTATITTADTQIAADGTTTTLVTIQLRDINGNNITTGGYPVTLGTTAGLLLGSLQDNGDGTYTQFLQSSSSAETAILTGTLDADGAGGNPAASIDDDATVEFVASTPSIEGVKTVALTDGDSSGGLSAGDVLVYTITATNSGDVTLTGVSVAEDTLTQADATPAANAFGAGDFSTSDPTTLAPGESAVFTGSYTVAQADVDAGGLSNAARVAGTPSGGGTAVEDVTDDGDDGDGNTADDATVIAAPVPAPAPALELVLLEATAPSGVTEPLVPGTSVIDMDGDGQVSPGDRVYYVYHVANVGNVTVTGIGIDDRDAVVTGGPIDLVPGAADTATFNGYQVITQADIDAGELANQATATGSSPSGSDDVSDVSDDAGPGSDATVTSFPAVKPLVILPQIEDELRAILEVDLANTLSQHSRQFGRLSASAAERLRFGDMSDAGCGTLDPFDPDGQAMAADETMSLYLSATQITHDCAGNHWIIREFDMSFDHDADLGERFDLTFTEMRERFHSQDRLRGWFWGGWASKTAVESTEHAATGEILGFGAHVGAYAAERLESDLVLDYYGALSAGRKEFGLSFDLADPIDADGDYLFATIFAGVGLSGEMLLNDWTITPAIRLDLAHAFVGDASVAAEYSTLSAPGETGSIPLNDQSAARIMAEIMFGNDPEMAGDGVGFWDGMHGRIEFAPRIFCDVAFGQSDNACGLGGYVEYVDAHDTDEDEVSLRLDYEHRNGGDYSLSGQLRFSRNLANGNGTLLNMLSISEEGAATVTSSVEFSF